MCWFATLTATLPPRAKIPAPRVHPAQDFPPPTQAGRVRAAKRACSVRDTTGCRSIQPRDPTRPATAQELNAVVPRARRHGAPPINDPSESAQGHSLTSSSTQSKVLVTAFFQLRNRRSRSSSSILGSQRLSSAQLSVTSCSPSQKPTAMPAA